MNSVYLVYRYSDRFWRDDFDKASPGSLVVVPKYDVWLMKTGGGRWMSTRGEMYSERHHGFRLTQLLGNGYSLFYHRTPV